MEIKKCPRHKCKHYTRFPKYMSTGHYWACGLLGGETCQREPSLSINAKTKDMFDIKAEKAKEWQGEG